MQNMKIVSLMALANKIRVPLLLKPKVINSLYIIKNIQRRFPNSANKIFDNYI